MTKSSPGNKDQAIRSLPDHIIRAVDDMLRAGRPYSEVARYVHTQGYLENVVERSLEKAVERYKAHNATRLLPNPVLVVAGEVDALEKLEEVLPKTPKSYIDEMFEGIEQDVNEIAIMLKLIILQEVRVKKAAKIEEPMPMPMESTSREMDRLWGYLEKLMGVKMRLGVLPRVPQQIEMRTRSLNLDVDVGAGDIAKMVLNALMDGKAGVLGDGETFAETKSRLRAGLIDGE